MKVSSQKELQNVSEDETVILEDDITITSSFNTIATFSGVLEGNGNTIHDLDKMFIHTVTSEATIKNISFENIKLENVVRKRGGIIGINSGRIQSVQVTDGSVEIFDSIPYSEHYIGMLTGLNHGVIQDCTVSSCTAHARGTVGGIVGENRETVKECVVTNYESSGVHVGGLIGDGEDCTISDCKARELSLKSIESCGGIAGSLLNFEIDSTSVVGVHIEKAVISGGIVGSAEGDSEFTNCATSNSQISGYNSATGFVGLCERSKIKSSFVKNSSITGLQPKAKVDVFSCKYTNDMLNDGKKIDNCFSDDVSLKGQDIQLDYDYEITNSYFDIEIQSLKSITINKHSNDRLYITDAAEVITDGETVTVTDQKDLDSIQPFDTINLKDNLIIQEDIDLPDIFHGNLNGNSHTIANVSSQFFEFFSGSITNLSIHSKDIQQTDIVSFTGLIGRKGTGVIQNVDITVNIQNSLVENRLGVIAGKLEGGIVKDCTINGQVQDHGSEFGGIAGSIRNNSVIQNCTVHMSVQSEAGGLLVGSASGKCRILNCSTDGKIECDSHGGGIAGSLRIVADGNVVIANSESAATVISENSGGIVSRDLNGHLIKKCEFTGKVQGKKCGGIISISEGHVVICINKGTVETDNLAGGLVAETNGCEIEKSKNHGSVYSEKTGGGLVGGTSILHEKNKN